jgi:glycosyltransferase involved in cell wall biosynthesis
MRILFVSPRQCWPPVSGAKLRDYHFARALARQADVTYVHFLEPGSSPLTRTELPFCTEVISVPKPPAYGGSKIARGLAGRWPLPVLNYTSQEMIAALRTVTRGRRYDLIHLDIVQLAGYAETLAEQLDEMPRIVYNWHNIESELLRSYGQSAAPLPRRIYAAWTARRMEGVEHDILRTSFGHIVCSEEERKELLGQVPGARIAVVENGVDTAYFADGPATGPRNRIVFVGSMNYHPNIEAALSFTRDVWPHMRERLPGYRFTIVGSNPVPAVLALRDVPGVEVTGTVPDVRPFYREALATVVPLRTGGGTRLKILESMAAAVPVVSTAFGAERLAVTPGKNIVLVNAGDAAAWTRELAVLADGESRRGELVEAAVQLVRERYDWTILGDLLCKTYREWLGNSA